VSFKRTGLTAATSYLQMAGSMASSLIIVRVATGYLSKDEFGLWSFIFGSIGYLMLVDFGISYAIGRLFVDPVAANDNRALSEWLYLTSVILVLQGALIAVIGLAVKVPVLAWFSLPENLISEAGSLWVWCLALQGVALPLRVFPALIYAQNRVYWVNLVLVLNAWVNLGCFWLFLKHGFGVMSYAYAGAIALAFTTLGHALIVFLPKDRIRLSFVAFPFHHLNELFKFSSAIFVVNIAKQVSGASQVLVLTKLLGLDSAAMYNVTVRLPQMAMLLLLKPYEAFSPRWISAWCTGDAQRVRSEFMLMFRLTILAVGCGCVGAMLVNPGFVRWWTKPEFFVGNLFNVWLSVSLVATMVQQCLSFVFNMTKRMGAYTAVLLAGAVVEIGLSIFLVKRFGLPGLPVSTLVTSLLFVLWFHIFVGFHLLGIKKVKPLVMDAATIGLVCIIAGMLVASNPSWIAENGLRELIFRTACASAICVPLLVRAWLVFEKYKRKKCGVLQR
jgi:O-antigen/teichoic acid export membrane protein